MAAWAGQGAARVLGWEGDAVVLERLSPKPSLTHDFEDAAALRIICGVVGRLHEAAPVQTPVVDTLRHRFRALERASGGDARFAASWGVARRLLASPRDEKLLHGDIHHGNVLWGGEGRGWLAIDPQAVIGERAYDYANLLKNPTGEVQLAEGRLRRAAEVIAVEAGLELARVLAWGQAHAALSAAWEIEDGRSPARQLAVVEIAARELATDEV
jgi:streptomycin 6-kinase